MRLGERQPIGEAHHDHRLAPIRPAHDDRNVRGLLACGDSLCEPLLHGPQRCAPFAFDAKRPVRDVIASIP